jgi:hypothetical protein
MPNSTVMQSLMDGQAIPSSDIDSDGAVWLFHVVPPLVVETTGAAQVSEEDGQALMPTA